MPMASLWRRRATGRAAGIQAFHQGTDEHLVNPALYAMLGLKIRQYSPGVMSRNLRFCRAGFRPHGESFCLVLVVQCGGLMCRYIWPLTPLLLPSSGSIVWTRHIGRSSTSPTKLLVMYRRPVSQGGTCQKGGGERRRRGYVRARPATKRRCFGTWQAEFGTGYVDRRRTGLVHIKRHGLTSSCLVRSCQTRCLFPHIHLMSSSRRYVQDIPEHRDRGFCCLLLDVSSGCQPSGGIPRT